MSPGHGILLVTTDPETESAVASTLESDRQFAATSVCPDLQNLEVQLKRDPAHGVLIDVDSQPHRILSELGPIITRFPDARFMVLSSMQSNDLMLKAMQIGVRHFLLKQSIASDLSGDLRRLMPKGSAGASKPGAVITVLSAGGGCGATTLAVNWANELHLQRSESVLLVDLDVAYGAVSNCLGLEGQYGVGDVLANRDRIDAQLILTTAVPYSESFDVLISPASTPNNESMPWQQDALRTAVEACTEAYRYTVIDAPRVSADIAATLAHMSDLTLIVMQLNVKDLLTARKLMTSIVSRGVPQERIVPSPTVTTNGGRWSSFARPRRSWAVSPSGA